MAAARRPRGPPRLLRLATASGALATRTGTGRGAPWTPTPPAAASRTPWRPRCAPTDRVHGLLLVAGRLGDVTTFSRSDLALLETFGRHVATSLERGRLEENLRQVTDLKEQLRHQTLHDALTGLPNRALFLDRASPGRSTSPAARPPGRRPLPRPRRLQAGQRQFGHDAGDMLLRTDRRPPPRLPAAGRHRCPPGR